MVGNIVWRIKRRPVWTRWRQVAALSVADGPARRQSARRPK